MARAEVTGTTADVDTPDFPRQRSLGASLDLYLGYLVEMPAAALVVAEVVILFAGMVFRYVLHQPLVWSDELASILFLWLAMLGAVVAF
ncbi:MAG: TRAP transporter small permease subunit, partial [Nitrobacter sp.]